MKDLILNNRLTVQEIVDVGISYECQSILTFALETCRNQNTKGHSTISHKS